MRCLSIYSFRYLFSPNIAVQQTIEQPLADNVNRALISTNSAIPAACWIKSRHSRDGAKAAGC